MKYKFVCSLYLVFASGITSAIFAAVSLLNVLAFHFVSLVYSLYIPGLSAISKYLYLYGQNSAFVADLYVVSQEQLRQDMSSIVCCITARFRRFSIKIL